MTLRELLAAEGYDVLTGTKVIDYQRLQRAVMYTLSALHDLAYDLALEYGVSADEVWEKIISPEIRRDRDYLARILSKLVQWHGVDNEIGDQRRRLERKWLSRC